MHVYVAWATEQLIFEMMMLEIGYGVAHIRLPALKLAAPDDAPVADDPNRSVEGIRQRPKSQLRTEGTLAEF